jgi:hypothetical protein
MTLGRVVVGDLDAVCRAIVAALNQARATDTAA